MGDNLTAAEYADREARFGVVPVLGKERMYSLFDTIFVAGSYAIATWCYFQGASLAYQMSMVQALMSTFGVCLSFIILICLIGVMSSKYGIDHWLLSRAVWGEVGTYIVLVAAMFSTWGWGAINAQMFGESLVKLLASAGADVSSGWWVKGLGILCVVLGLLVAMRGAGAVRVATRIMGYLLVAIAIGVVVLIAISPDLGAAWRQGPLAEVEPGQERAAYMLGTEWNVAFVLSWFPVIGALTRLVKGQRQAHWGLWVGYGFMLAAYVYIGVSVAHVSAAGGAEITGDPTAYLLALGGPWLGSLTLLLVGVANVSTTAVGLYGTSISTKILWPTWRYEYVVGFWAVVVGVLTLWGGVWEYYATFLAVMGIINGPAVALLLVDYWIVRRRRLSLRSIYEHGAYRYTGGINIVAIVSFAIGIAAFVLVYNPIDYVVRVQSVFNALTVSGFAILVSGAAYFLLSLIPPIRRYLLRDRAAGSTAVC